MSPPSSTAETAIGRGSAALITLFFVSGAASLVYEAVWNRLLVLQMGNTAYALTTNPPVCPDAIAGHVL